MRITDVETFLHPNGNCFLRLETDEGYTGVGEAGLTRRGRAIATIIDEFEPDLIGADPRRIEHLWQTLFRGGFFPGGVVQSAAVSAVDIALWDLKARALGVPVYDLLGGLTRDRVPCYPHVSPSEPDELVAECRAKMDDGWRFVRWGLCDPRDGDVFEPSRAVRFGVEQVKAVREACGEELEICVDVHTRLDPPSAVEFCNRIEPYHPYFVEDPLRSEYPEKLRHLRQQTSVPIAVGEQYDSKWAFRSVIEEDLLDYCRVDLCIAGGLTEARKIADACETHYIQLAPHNPGGLSPVATAACLHLCVSSPLVAAQELRDAPPNFADAFPTQLPFEDGHLLPPDRPGLGVELDESALEDAEPYEPSEAHGFERQDGSYTNW